MIDALEAILDRGRHPVKLHPDELLVGLFKQHVNVLRWLSIALLSSYLFAHHCLFIAPSPLCWWGEISGSSHDRARSDRKSTRLNSSHVKISYAVFCLK